MEKRLKRAIKYAEDMLMEYKKIGSDGAFGAMRINQELEQANKILSTFKQRSKIEIKEIIDSLLSIE